MPGRGGGFNVRQVARPGRLLCRASGAQFCCNIAATRVNHGAILNQIVGGVQCRESLHSRYLFLEGVSQMVYILFERLLTLVRPAFDLVLRRIRSLKRCVQACCKIETPRYAPQFGSRLHFKRCQALPKETPFFGTPCFLFFFCFFLALQRLARLKCNLQPNCKHI